MENPNQNPNQNLVDRQIYFNLSISELAECNVDYLTPGKLYTIIEKDDTGLTYILADDGYKITAPIDVTSAHFDFKTKWQLVEEEGEDEEDTEYTEEDKIVNNIII